MWNIEKILNFFKLQGSKIRKWCILKKLKMYYSSLWWVMRTVYFKLVLILDYEYLNYDDESQLKILIFMKNWGIISPKKKNF